MGVFRQLKSIPYYRKAQNQNGNYLFILTQQIKYLLHLVQWQFCLLQDAYQSVDQCKGYVEDQSIQFTLFI